MDHLEEQDIVRLKELLRRAGEFIAYFELADTKMVEWRQDMEQRSSTHFQQFQQQFQALQSELNLFHEMLSEAGLARLRLVADNVLQQGKEHLRSLKEAEQQIFGQISTAQQEIKHLGERGINEIKVQATQAIERMDNHLGQYDVKHFNRIANESCEHIEQSAKDAISKSGRLLRLFQWKTVGLVFITTLATAFAVSLYLSDEYPWEIHQQVHSERSAGKMLISAWPYLTPQERTKIIGKPTPATR